MQDPSESNLEELPGGAGDDAAENQPAEVEQLPGAVEAEEALQPTEVVHPGNETEVAETDQVGEVVPADHPAESSESAEAATAITDDLDLADKTEAVSAGLGLLCGMIEGASRGLFMLPSGSHIAEAQGWYPAARWPDSEGDLSRLFAVADAASEKGRTVVRPHPKPAGASAADVHDLAQPIQVGDLTLGIVAVEVADCPEQRLPTVVRQLQSGTFYLANLLKTAPGAESGTASRTLESALWLLATCLEHERFRGAATAVATDLAAQLECERVSIGSWDGLQTKVEALSHSADFGERMNLIRRIGGAMDEAIDQRSSVVVPAFPDAPILGTSAHEELIREEGSGTSCSVLLTWDEDVIGAITLERAANRPFRPPEVETLEDTAALLGPILELKRRDDRWLIRKGWDSLRDHARKLLGPAHLGMKAAAIGAVLLLLFLTFATRMFRVSAPAALEGAVMRAAVAPIDGFILEAPVRAGDLVTEGEMLAVLDDRTLRLEQRNWQSQRDQIESEFLEAMAEQERVRMNVLRAGIEQADVQLGLIAEQIERLRIAAPIDGLVVSGDLSQSIGAPVEQGSVLFEVAPLDAYRLMLEVDERDIAYVEVGQRGSAVLTAMPETTHEFTVEKVTPVSESEEGTNYFLVEARLDEAPDILRPGMEGIGKVDVERSSLLWILTRRITDWLRLWIWSWRGPGG